MSEFLKHGPCTQCGSSDGRAFYTDGGSWCFVCHSLKRGRVPGETTNAPKKETRALPEDISKEYTPEMQAWVERYGLTVEDLIRNEVYCSKYQRRLFFCWKESQIPEEFGKGEGKLLAWQSRNFQEGFPKYTTSGNIEQLLPIYRRHWSRNDLGRVSSRENSTNLVLVEDCLSAIKTAKASALADASSGLSWDAMPCLTSSLSTDKLKRLTRLYGAFLVWLDADMFHNAQKMCRQLQLMGCEARAIWTKEDPKCYELQQIRDILLTGKASA